jgi:hypothetical protein
MDDSDRVGEEEKGLSLNRLGVFGVIVSALVRAAKRP